MDILLQGQFTWKCVKRIHALCIPPIKFRMPEPPVLMKFVMYNMAYEPISMAYFWNPSHRSHVSSLLLQGSGPVECMPPFSARIWLGKHSCGSEYTTIEELLDTLFSVPSVSYERTVCGYVRVSPYRCSAKTFPWQQIVGGVVFFAVHVVWKKSRQFSSSQNFLFWNKESKQKYTYLSFSQSAFLVSVSTLPLLSSHLVSQMSVCFPPLLLRFS